MEYVLSTCFLVLFSLHLTRAVEHSAGIGPENTINITQELSQSPVCSIDIDMEIERCAEDLVFLARYDFPWVVTDVAETQTQMGNRQKVKDGIQDPLDPINQVCGLFQGFLKCLDQYAIPDVCLIGGDRPFRLHIVFTFVCNIQPRSTDLLHSLSCLKETRILDLMVFHLANKPGTHTDDMAQGTVNTFFKFLNSDLLISTYFFSPEGASGVVTEGLICLPESVLSRDFSFLIDSQCGTHAADLARDYYLYFRRRYLYLLGKTGFPTNICDKKTERKPHRLQPPNEVHAVSGDVRRDVFSSRIFSRFLDENSPGTALDTVFGRGLRNDIGSVTEQEFCNPTLLSASFQACTLLSYDPSGKARFNVLQFAHSTTLGFEPFADSSRMEIFRSCWNLLQQICGTNATYVDYGYRVSAGSRQIQAMMDNLTCEWQDMLLQYYVEAAENGNLWPGPSVGLRRPMLLSKGYFTYGAMQNSMNDLVHVLNHGVNEIAARCSLSSARRIQMFYERLRYGWYNELRLEMMLKEYTSSTIERNIMINQIY